MRFFRRGRRRAQIARAEATIPDATKTHLEDFIASRQGVEAWVECAAGFNKASILLIDKEGESTRRSVESESWAFDFAKKNGIPAYQAGVVPYPQRKRDFDAKSRGRKHPPIN
ncbi:hypothetical protein [Propionimicrobium lymphophilum]|uniref:hypothetical protein n=1 Tax=Propionimicrobium lymphophilum TaxID=33012 RepID=UPI00055F56DF|nr:hypothetical protein [Propionimicrobium lymphophilum]